MAVRHFPIGSLSKRQYPKLGIRVYPTAASMGRSREPDIRRFVNRIVEIFLRCFACGRRTAGGGTVSHTVERRADVTDPVCRSKISQVMAGVARIHITFEQSTTTQSGISRR